MNAQPDTSSPNNTGRLPDFIAPIKAGSTDTLLSARRGNEVIKMCNAITRMRGKFPIVVLQADAGILIELRLENNAKNQNVGTDEITIGYGDNMTFQGKSPDV